jgi:hypothetical protein
MNWLKRKIRNWLDSDKLQTSRGYAEVAQPEQPDSNNFSLSIMPAMNGKVIQIRTYQFQSRGPDWKTEYYVVPDGERLTDAVTILLMAKNLEKA